MTDPAGISSLGVLPVPRQQSNGPNLPPGAACAGGAFSNYYARWTDEEKETLRHLRLTTDLPMREIAARLNRTTQACELMAHRMKLPKRPLPTLPKRRAVRQPIDPNELLRRGISPQTVALLTRRMK